MDALTTTRIAGILNDAEGGTGSPIDRLFPHVYDELRDVAHRLLRHEHAAETLSTTVLVHEAYLRLAPDERVTARGRAYFFAAGAQAMRRIVVDYARRRNRLKRGSGVPALELDDALVAEAGAAIDVLDLERGLERLALIAERPTRVVECRFYGGLTVEETALALDVTERTVKRDWVFARAWLFDYLNDGDLAETAR
ncbi:MAG TPA: ECF-type sigma factor [Longimicrobiales bacterium]|nr:ECF-type sigma factor [Longimicrobiales bacterium]